MDSCAGVSEFVRERGITTGNGDRHCCKALLTDVKSVSILHLETTTTARFQRSEKCSEKNLFKTLLCFVLLFSHLPLNEFFHRTEPRIRLKC